MQETLCHVRQLRCRILRNPAARIELELNASMFPRQMISLIDVTDLDLGATFPDNRKADRIGDPVSREARTAACIPDIAAIGQFVVARNQASLSRSIAQTSPR